MKGFVRRWGPRLALAALALALLPVLIAVSGVVPIEASRGHWAPTEWFLRFTMRRTVAVRSLTVGQAELDAPWLVMKGAGHYETGCRSCHGEPGLGIPAVARAMLPHPPDLARRSAEWEHAELFYVVKHGLKFTGMPAWPAQTRDDEVWAMVAFLRALPELDHPSYQRLVFGEAAGLEPSAGDAGGVALDGSAALVAGCARCHGAVGEGRGSAAFPKLAGQSVEYQVAALRAYARGARHSGMMQPIAERLDAPAMRALAAHYAALGPGLASHDDAPVTRAEEAELGRAIAARGIAERGIPSCQDCHGPGDHRRNPYYPNLAGQHADYLVLQLRLFRDRRRGGSAYAHLMERVASRLTPEEMRAVARYYASLGR